MSTLISTPSDPSNHTKVTDISYDAKQEETPELANLSIEHTSPQPQPPAQPQPQVQPKEESDNDSDSDSDGSSDSDSDEDDNIYQGLSADQIRKMKQAMGSLQSEYQIHLDSEKDRLIKETQQQFGFNLAITISRDEAEFIGNFCKNQQINLVERLQEEGSFFLESMREMIEQQSQLNNNNNNNNYDDKSNGHGDDSDDDDDSDEDWVVAEKKKKDLRKKKRSQLNLGKNTNLDGSKRCGRLLLNEALKNVSSMDGWSDARKKAWMTRKTNPNSYFYRFNVPGQPQRNGKWSKNEHKLFMEQALAQGVNVEWGIFSKKIPGRVGYQCSNYWRGLVKDAYAIDPNYKITVNDNGTKKLHFKRNIPTFSISQEYRRFAITIVKDASKTFKNLPMKHPSHPNDKYIEQVDKYYANWADNKDKNCNKNGKVNKNKNKNKKKRKKRRRKRNDSDDDGDWDDYRPSTKKMKYNNDVDDGVDDSNNPMPDFIDIMTGAAVIKPTISPYGHVLGYDTWTKILRTSKTRNMCPFTLQKMTRRSLIKLDKVNYDQYKDKITNITKEQQELLAVVNQS